MSRLRFALGLAILFTLFTTGTALAGEQTLDRTAQPAALASGDEVVSEALPAEADGLRTASGTSEDPGMSVAPFTLDNGLSELVLTAGNKGCGPWKYAGCCGNAKKSERDCWVGPDHYTQTKCEAACPL
ncbi:MAG: hypothetical protein KDD47_27550 [Acidobacteria bacterium]|nr:hypothetical protein [Acidobacteriota bacterium]